MSTLWVVVADDYSRFSDGAHRAVVLAERVARRRGHVVVGPEDLLVALAETDPAARHVLEQAGADAGRLRARIDEWTPSSPAASAFASFSPLLQRAIQRAVRFAAQERADQIDGRHLLRGLLDDEDEIVWRVLISLGVDPGPLARPASSTEGADRRVARRTAAAAAAALPGPGAGAGGRRPTAWSLFTAVWRP